MQNDEPRGKGPKRGGPRMAGGGQAGRQAGAGENKRMGGGARVGGGQGGGGGQGRGGGSGGGGGGAHAPARASGPRMKAGAGAQGGAGAKAGPRANARGGRGAGAGAVKLGGLRRRRMFDNGELRLVLLKLIGDEPRHGYELIKSIEELAGGGYAPSPGVIYPTLTMLGETGHVSSDDDSEGRRRFSITGAGSAELVDNEEQVGKLFTRLSTHGEKHKRTESMPVRRAMTNLKVALQDRLSRGDVADETLLQVAALIDEAAQKIERLD